MNLDGIQIPRVPRTQGIKKLGAQVSLDNSASAAVDRCCINAWAAFNKHKVVLCSKMASPARRLHLLNRFVKPVATYAIGSLNLTVQHLRQLHSLHFRIARKVLGIRRQPDIMLEDYLKNIAGKINELMAKEGLQWWNEIAFRLNHSWAGHVGRMSVYDPERFVYRALVYRNYNYLVNLEQEFGHQCHGRKFRVWRWERAFYQYYGPDWIQVTCCSEQWANSVEEWLNWRINICGKKRLTHNRGVRRFRLSLEAALASQVTEDTDESTSSCSSSSSSSGVVVQVLP